MNEVLKTEWSTEELLKEARESYGTGIFLCGFTPKLVYVPLSKNEMISLDGLLDDFESNYFMLYEQGLSIIPIDPDSRDKTRAERESFLSEVSIARYPISRSDIFSAIVDVPKGEHLVYCKGKVLEIIHGSKWAHIKNWL